MPGAGRMVARPDSRPASRRFSSGPCTKHPGWSLAAPDSTWLGRSHRAPGPTATLAEVIERSRSLLGVPEAGRLAIVPGSDTAAVEMAMWSMLGARGVDVLSMDSVSRHWAVEAMRHLAVDARVLEGPGGRPPDLAEVDSPAAWCSPGTAPRRGCASRTASGSPGTGSG